MSPGAELPRVTDADFDASDADADEAAGTDDADALRTVGVLGGMSAESTVHYYQGLNTGVNDALGGHAAAPVVIDSVNFADVATMIDDDRWDEAGAYLADHARAVERAGADFVVMATNTMHRVADDLTAALSIPFVHIVDPTAEAIADRGIDTVGVLGTAATMEGAFYRERFADHGIDTVAPDAGTREEIDRIIFEELVHGEVRDDSRETYLDTIGDLRAAGAEGVVLGCTEIEMLVGASHVPETPLFDTTALHVERAVELCLGERDLSG
jgi:aspartate racemase